MEADVDGQLAADYRGYIRHQVVKPTLDRIKNAVHTHYAAVEAPPNEWLTDTFPEHSKADSPNYFADGTVNYVWAWDRVLAEWDAGRLDVLFSPSHIMSFWGLLKFNVWSKERGETKQHELIGMSSGRKGASAKITTFLSDQAGEE
jgi:hypothetical protein